MEWRNGGGNRDDAISREERANIRDKGIIAGSLAAVFEKNIINVQFVFEPVRERMRIYDFSLIAAGRQRFLYHLRQRCFASAMQAGQPECKTEVVASRDR